MEQRQILKGNREGKPRDIIGKLCEYSFKKGNLINSIKYSKSQV